jgi:hypothetical protein
MARTLLRLLLLHHLHSANPGRCDASMLSRCNCQ